MPISFPQLEENILERWKKEKIFPKSLKARKRGPRFVFYEGPPTANAKPGLHHVLARAFKDLIPRYKTMQGFYVDRKAGWDTHGLPVEIQIEKELGISSKRQIENLVEGDKFESIKQFNKRCRDSVFRFIKDWEKLTARIAFWVDFENAYITYTNEYIESLWWLLKNYWDKGLLYQDYKVVPYCARCGTALSSHEVALGYKDVKETSIYVKFKLSEQEDTYILAWTTTPWTLPGNVALAVHPEIIYVKVKQGDEHYILAKDRLEILEGDYQIEQEFPGKRLVNLKYEPLFDFIPGARDKAYYVALANFVTTQDGTGVVHTAVMYGEDDFRLGKDLGLPTWHTVDEEGKFVKEVKLFVGLWVKDAEPKILEDLRQRNLVYKTDQTEHSYPFCWRCDTQLLYYAKMSWYIRVTDFKDKLIANNQTINWVPENIKYGRFGDWLENVKDWAISRERYWGVPLPIWICDNCDERLCVGSIEEIRRLSTAAWDKNSDLHRPFIDEVKLKCDKCDGAMTRVKEVIDVWFDSGAMPFAQWHYPFEHKEKIDKGEAYPADYISEAIDQTRGWFYTLLAVAALMDKPAPYKNVVCLGHVLDSKGQKMSKSKGNIVDPWSVINKHGSDALRWYLFTVNPPGEPKRFDIKGVEEVVKKVFLILWNVYTFYETYAPEKKPRFKFGQRHPLDIWIASRTEQIIEGVTNHLEKYLVLEAGRMIAEYIDDLSTWYLRRSRERFKSADEKDREDALLTLGNCLMTLSKLMAPFTPFIADELYLRLEGGKDSVHLEDWPSRFLGVDDQVINNMKLVRKISELGHALRDQAGIKVRQALSEVKVNEELPGELLALVRDELNVKKVSVEKDLVEMDNWIVAGWGDLKVALNMELTAELKEEGVVRESTRQINSLRKKMNLTVHDRITLKCSTSDKILEHIIKKYHEQIEKEVLSDHIEILSEVGGETVDINEFKLTCKLERL